MRGKPASLVEAPAADKVIGDWKPTTAIPDAVRQWGYYPDLRDWAAGDLVLTQSMHPEWLSRQIAVVQSEYGEEAALWTHAATYLGDGLMLCEAVEKGVKVTPIFEYVGSHRLCVRRSRHAMDPALGWAIAVAAATHIGSAYDFKFIAKVAARSMWSHLYEKSMNVPGRHNALVCSTLYSTAHTYATGVNIADRTNGLCLPAFLSMSGDLEDVDHS